jgi:hypothetical protein
MQCGPRTGEGTCGNHLKRREFITLLGGTAAGWPFASHAQQPAKLPIIGVLMNLAADDPESQRRMTAFVQGLQELSLDAHPIFLTMQVVKSVTSDGTEIRNYINGRNVASL